MGVTIKVLGLPIIFSPVSDKITELCVFDKNTKLDDLKQVAICILNEHYAEIDFLEKESEKNNTKAPTQEKNIQFIYDNYHDVAEFKRLINE
ncbi:MAG: hypothetical protein Q9M36_14555 [Sulfurovum sp.]|nr:hypothetical protein [Sulfurovum sp.]